ncbi:trypsin-1 [Rhynchophorus ferrugineus]|uniref:Peptidase S1 domain-containing protein n=1 Tax=Rhynchophorus ferrugineus TaxID=354439 RepID=A0A834HPT0_RHYFE|nr:hypothetical protein GWI33_021048 [Rhynchophorus ferrugineus]
MNVLLTLCLLLDVARCACGIWSFWKLGDHWTSRIHSLDGYFNQNTGRVFVTMFGYPSKCHRKGSSHSCTLSVACWWVGGSSQSGCGASPWIVACCVKNNKNHYREPEIDVYEDVPEIKTNQVSSLMERRNGLVDLQEESCGISADRLMQKRIVGGNEARFGQYPWQAYIKISSYQCGGVLVSRKYVATAAHCIFTAKLKDILVYLGELDTEDTGKYPELQPAELHRVKKLLIHPKFQYKSTQPDRYDLALLRLVTEAGFGNHIASICLPYKGIKLTGREAIVAGWGKVQAWEKSMGTNILRSVTVPIIDIKECRAWHKIRQIDVELHPEMMCAGHKDGKHDACLGDSGGPLIILDQGRWTLAGITSAGFGCGEPHQPGIYHKIPATVNWIRSIIND